MTTIQRLDERESGLWAAMIAHSSPELITHLLQCQECATSFCGVAQEIIQRIEQEQRLELAA